MRAARGGLRPLYPGLRRAARDSCTPASGAWPAAPGPGARFAAPGPDARFAGSDLRVSRLTTPVPRPRLSASGPGLRLRSPVLARDLRISGPGLGPRTRNLRFPKSGITRHRNETIERVTQGFPSIWAGIPVYVWREERAKWDFRQSEITHGRPGRRGDGMAGRPGRQVARAAAETGRRLARAAGSPPRPP